METLFIPAFNFVLWAAMLGFLLRKPLKAYVEGRHQTIRKTIGDVANELTAAQSQFDEFSTKLSALGAEAEKLRTGARTDGEALKTRVVDHARKTAGQLVEDSKTSSNAMFEDLKRELRSELSERLLENAERIIKTKLTGDDRVRIRKEFSSQMASEMRAR